MKTLRAKNLDSRLRAVEAYIKDSAIDDPSRMTVRELKKEIEEQESRLKRTALQSMPKMRSRVEAHVKACKAELAKRE